MILICVDMSPLQLCGTVWVERVLGEERPKHRQREHGRGGVCRSHPEVSAALPGRGKGRDGQEVGA